MWGARPRASVEWGPFFLVTGDAEDARLLHMKQVDDWSRHLHIFLVKSRWRRGGLVFFMPSFERRLFTGRPVRQQCRITWSVMLLTGRPASRRNELFPISFLFALEPTPHPSPDPVQRFSSDRVSDSFFCVLAFTLILFKLVTSLISRPSDGTDRIMPLIRVCYL